MNMTCKEIQDVLVTDYMDGELEVSVSYEIDRHMKACPACREFAEAARLAVKPLRDAAQEEPPETVWKAIEETLRHERQERVPLTERIFGVFQWGLRHRRPVFAFSSVMTVALVAAMLVTQLPYHRRLAVGEFLSEQTTYLHSLERSMISDKNVDFGTGVERLLD